LLSEFLDVSSLNSNNGHVSGYAWRRAAAACVYAVLPAAVGLLVTRFLNSRSKDGSHFGLPGRAYTGQFRRKV
jgi:hypothetical protein